jgi:hypothetical protein
MQALVTSINNIVNEKSEIIKYVSKMHMDVKENLCGVFLALILAFQKYSLY